MLRVGSLLENFVIFQCKNARCLWACWVLWRYRPWIKCFAACSYCLIYHPLHLLFELTNCWSLLKLGNVYILLTLFCGLGIWLDIPKVDLDRTEEQLTFRWGLVADCTSPRWLPTIFHSTFPSALWPQPPVPSATYSSIYLVRFVMNMADTALCVF